MVLSAQTKRNQLSFNFSMMILSQKLSKPNSCVLGRKYEAVQLWWSGQSLENRCCQPLHNTMYAKSGLIFSVSLELQEDSHIPGIVDFCFFNYPFLSQRTAGDGLPGRQGHADRLSILRDKQLGFRADEAYLHDADPGVEQTPGAGHGVEGPVAT